MAKAVGLNIIANSRYASYYKKNVLPAFREAVDASLYPMERTNRFERLVYRTWASIFVSVLRRVLIFADVCILR